MKTKTTKKTKPNKTTYPDCKTIAAKFLLLSQLRQSSNVAELMGQYTVKLLAYAVMVTGSIEKALEVISRGINIAASAYKEK